MSDAISSPGFHSITFKVVYNSFSESKTIKIFTFPHILFAVQHGCSYPSVAYIDTGISDNITASKYIDNLTFYALGSTYAAKSINITPESAGNFTVNYSLSYGSYHFSDIAAYIDVFNHPKAIGISYSNLSYNSSSCPPYTTFDINMVSSGGDILNHLYYCVYINGSLYTNFYIPQSSSHFASCSINESGTRPFHVYFIVKDNYYPAKSNTITVGS